MAGLTREVFLVREVLQHPSHYTNYNMQGCQKPGLGSINSHSPLKTLMKSGGFLDDTPHSPREPLQTRCSCSQCFLQCCSQSCFSNNPEILVSLHPATDPFQQDLCTNGPGVFHLQPAPQVILTHLVFENGTSTALCTMVDVAGTHLSFSSDYEPLQNRSHVWIFTSSNLGTVPGTQQILVNYVNHSLTLPRGPYVQYIQMCTP